MDNLNITIIDNDPAISSQLKKKVNGLGLGSCTTASTDISIEELAEIDPNLVILGPSLDMDTCLKCIHKFKIIDSFMPVLTSCTNLFLPEGTDITPFQGIYCIGEIPEPGKAMREFHRVLSPSGTLAFSEFLWDPDYPRVKTLVRKAAAAGFQLKKKVGNVFYYTLIFEK